MADSDFNRDFDKLLNNLQRVIRGKAPVLRLALTCFFAEGHLLIEDVPGTGKTSIARALSASIRGKYRRIQFTPDLLPTDVTGAQMLNAQRTGFQFHHGAVFANIVLADEINRASPKTQAALLEVMEERTVTAEAETHAVPRPFIVIATQNPVELDGTYPLPEAQLDRFLLRIEVGYPDARSEREILNGYHEGSAIDSLPQVLTVERVHQMIAEAADVTVVADLQDYIVALASATRTLPEVRLGVSPRGSIALMRAARVLALADGRSYVVPEDIKYLAIAAFAHRLIMHPEAELRGVLPAEIVKQVLAAVPVPRVTSGV